MSQYTAIAEVGESLLALLRKEMTPEPISQPELIGLSSPAQSGDLALALFLYEIRESQERQHMMISEGTDQLRYPPMTVNLSYILTAHSPAEQHTRMLDEHRILGRAMQVLYDNAILRGDQLQGSLANMDTELRVVVEQPPVDKLIQLFPHVPYKLSIGYSVGPVHIDSTRVRSTKRVLERDIRIRGEGHG
ncbi:hypothetical protein AB432_021725 [Brevibacillus brevis]|nr:DUF4255 domain-containing protein [Brevibacillus brevis]AWX57491.1 hypothetical protein AB432_021725 [Brevibacillus brevis]NRR23777.1 DUF4255 domain-containing protein [Brevibacillus sp. MS2.2]